uniref:Uncharacterized protein n=1 Tax=Rhizochromulina marina TaxID=1034831 RepID=A0A7S2S6D4_9STRA|mmetsp:Transcript_2551/g.7492  ORF Transcript_2551/g.7492 Transcript_2551/m.7492 type:complete len:131 (+) Transcript_2551:136-528(+)|eukprot:CAMPEP_0118985950 /NCGR_PEP_ID=MMETSP1173-20130426/41106_1 /TAXON_ID=1034831 /ORGANISM="Rhizochromulina marina cf, Strain CCMP1243" /LENGTH=130 /DNA_ID=CAMNT_0006936699 /DNA_START=97 /DNA_END=489 /DNA_ORIENTATION=-
MAEVLASLLEEHPSVQVLVISTESGMPLLRAVSPHLGEPQAEGDEVPEAGLGMLFTHIQHEIQKIQLGGARSVTGFFDNFILAHLHRAPFVITMMADAAANVPAISSFDQTLAPVLMPLKEALARHSLEP